MTNTKKPRGHRPKKANSRRITANLQNLEVADDLPLNTTETIELSLKMLSIVKDAAIEGKPEAISLLANLGLVVKIEDKDPIVILRHDGNVAAWIC